LGPIVLNVSRTIGSTFTERYSFSNVGNQTVDITSYGGTGLAIYTPFNDHYTNSSDVYENRAHTHVWASGGTSAWVKQIRMGGRGPHLGMIVTEGSLVGYSIESREEITQSDTRGVFVVHPDISNIDPNTTSSVSWTMFWHNDWTDFFNHCGSISNQFVHFNASTLTSFPGEKVDILVSGAVGPNHTLGDGHVSIPLTKQGSSYLASFATSQLGEHRLYLQDKDFQNQNTSVIVNVVPRFQDIIANRTHFIAKNQQIDPSSNATIGGAYVPYDNQINAVVTFDPFADRNAARERIGMGVLISRWLYNRPDELLHTSLDTYYNYICNKLQNSSGYVFDGPLGSGDQNKRLYNWPWVMQLHLRIYALGWHGPSRPTDAGTPLQRFMRTVESFYANNGTNFYAIGIPVLESLRILNTSSTKAEYNRLMELFTAHATQYKENGIHYPSSEVNFEQSIVAPAAIFLLEMHRATGNLTWLEAAIPHLNLLELFGGQQPDYHLRDVAIRHWDGCKLTSFLNWLTL
jgi:hypothetical protein